MMANVELRGVTEWYKLLSAPALLRIAPGVASGIETLPSAACGDARSAEGTYAKRADDRRLYQLPDDDGSSSYWPQENLLITQIKRRK